jgi:hypothetical protein
MKFFRYFPTVPYQFDVNGELFTLRITNPTVHFKIMERLKEHIAVLYDYVIQSDERPDSVATKLYGSPDYTWVILILNNILTLFDWPLTQAEFDRYIICKYGSIRTAQITSIYKTKDNYYIDVDSYNAMSADQRGAVTNAYDDELDKNEAKRRIKVVPAELVEPLVLELQKT